MHGQWDINQLRGINEVCKEEVPADMDGRCVWRKKIKIWWVSVLGMGGALCP